MTPFLRIALGSIAVLVAVATLLLWLLNRRLGRAAAERERLLRHAAEASEAERRRIARDLHDGVVQDLAGTTFAVAALANRVPADERADVDELADTLRRASRDLRSLLVEIHPPELTAATLPASLQDLVAPAAAAGVEATVTVDPLPPLPPDQAALLWRVAQEAVRNALRHARCRRLDVRVRVGDRVVLEVEDDGVGFVPEEVGATRFGLRGLRSLVADRGGRLDVSTRPGEGTRVRLTLDPATRPPRNQEVLR
jgi:signal transduction histidine kinase